LKDTFLSLEVFIWYTEYCNAFANVLLSRNNNYHKTLLIKQKLSVYQTQPPTPLPESHPTFPSHVTAMYQRTCYHGSCIMYT